MEGFPHHLTNLKDVYCDEVVRKDKRCIVIKAYQTEDKETQEKPMLIKFRFLGNNKTTGDMFEDGFIKDNLLAQIKLTKYTHLANTLAQYKGEFSSSLSSSSPSVQSVVEVFYPWFQSNNFFSNHKNSISTHHNSNNAKDVVSTNTSLQRQPKEKEKEKEKEPNKKESRPSKQEIMNTFLKHYNKHKSGAEYVVVRETIQMYVTITKPYINAMPTNDIQWMKDVLDGKKEYSRVIYRDPQNDFVVLIAKNWDSHVNCEANPNKYEWKNIMSAKNIQNYFHVMALVNDPKLKCVRDLCMQNHVDLLKRIKNHTLEEIEKIYNLKPHAVLGFVHYMPHYYRLHIHFRTVPSEREDNEQSWSDRWKAISISKALLLDDIIENLEMDLGYYQKCSLTCRVKRTHPLAATLKE